MLRVPERLKHAISLIAVSVMLGGIQPACSLFESEEDDDNTALLALLLLANSSGDSGCWTCNTNNDSSLPDWIKNNFSCMTITTSGSNYSFSSTAAPPYNSGYYGTSSGCYEDFPSGNSANPNTISSFNLVMTVPQSPDTSGSVTDLGTMGLAVNGVTLFNNQAAPGDTLADELATMDTATGHPNDVGLYHYHTEPAKITAADGALVGIALDGYPVFGQKEADNTTTATGLDGNGGHSHSHPTIGSTTYHYHVETGSNELILLQDFQGTKGSATN